jgi:hypothetical protein
MNGSGRPRYCLSCPFLAIIRTWSAIFLSIRAMWLRVQSLRKVTNRFGTNDLPSSKFLTSARTFLTKA